MVDDTVESNNTLENRIIIESSIESSNPRSKVESRVARPRMHACSCHAHTKSKYMHAIILKYVCACVDVRMGAVAEGSGDPP